MEQPSALAPTPAPKQLTAHALPPPPPPVPNHTGAPNGLRFQLARQTALEVNICVMFNGDASNLLISVRGFGIIGGGAVLFSGAALAGTTILPMLGETFLDTKVSLAPTQYPCQM